MKLKAFYKDLCQVFKKHFRPAIDKDPSEVKLIKIIASLQKQQKDMNDMRDSLGESVRMLGDSEVFKEFDKLQKLAPSEDGGNVDRSDKDKDRMFS